MTDFLSKPQWKSGESVAKFLDEYFTSQGWYIVPTSPQQERKLCLGDRVFMRGLQSYFVEYKSGIQSFYTGNIFLETVSVDSENKAGWVYTCQATFIFYAALLNNKILVFVPDDLRENVEQLRRQFREVKTGKNQNDGYDTHGLIIPLEYAEKHIARKVITLEASR